MNGVSGFIVGPRGSVSFNVAGVRGGGKQVEVKASVLPKVTADPPTIPVSPVTNGKHLSGLELADTEYGIPGQVDILLQGRSLARWSSMAGVSIPPERRQRSNVLWIVTEWKSERRT